MQLINTIITDTNKTFLYYRSCMITQFSLLQFYLVFIAAAKQYSRLHYEGVNYLTNSHRYVLHKNSNRNKLLTEYVWNIQLTIQTKGYKNLQYNNSFTLKLCLAKDMFNI